MFYGIRRVRAPELTPALWIDAHGAERGPLRLADLGDGPKVLFFYQHWSTVCQNYGFPMLKALIEGASTSVGFAVVQTVFEGAETNTLDKLFIDQRKYDLEVPFGHDTPASAQRVPRSMLDYESGGTPWFLVIDADGLVKENGFIIDGRVSVTPCSSVGNVANVATVS